ncbi:MAG TPA: DNA ligase D, partial [Thermoanaerobaculia bacterium]
MTPKRLLKKVFPPMLATLTDAPPPNDAEWAYELKYDGFRAVVAITDKGISMLSRNELDLAPRFPRTYEALKKIKAKELVVDGEVVVLDEKGAPRFQLLQQGGNERLIVFDILWFDGQDLRRLPYSERRKLLEHAFKKPPAGIAVSEVLEMPGEKALALAASNGWEGVIAKRKTSVYETRRSKEWLKIKAINEQEFAIVGFQPSNATDREIGSLHLAVNDHGALRYAGKVGTGFSSKLRGWLRDELMKDAIAKPMVKDAPRVKTAIWTKPRLVAQVAFSEWTGDHRLRHPSFLGLRDDKKVEEVVKEVPQQTTSKVTLTNPDRVIYPNDGITKKDITAYYEAMAEPMLHALKDRPLALEHWNQGIHKPAWFHQNIGKEAPKWLTVVETPTRTTKSGVAKHLVIDSVDALRYLAQMSALTLHMWSSRAESLEEPDWILFDLDPAKGKGIEQAIEAA